MICESSKHIINDIIDLLLFRLLLDIVAILGTFPKIIPSNSVALNFVEFYAIHYRTAGNRKKLKLSSICGLIIPNVIFVMYDMSL